MAIKFNVPGKKRRDLVNAISVWLEEDIEYAGAPSFAYHIGESYTVDRDGNLIPGEAADEDTTERLVEHLYDEGFEMDVAAEETEREVLAIQMPRLAAAALANLKALVEAKGALIKKALGMEELPIEERENMLDFAWFKPDASPDEVKAYMNLVTKLCEMAKNAKRVTAKEKTEANEKYAFRCFLLRLGFIGDEYKTDRKVLLANLDGNSAFKSEKEKEAV